MSTPDDETAPLDDAAVELWLRTEVVAAYDALRADPSLAISMDEMRADLAAWRAEWTAGEQGWRRAS